MAETIFLLRLSKIADITKNRESNLIKEYF